MFKSVIHGTPFTSEAAGITFGNIYGDSYGGDVSFISTLRALLASRISSDETVVLRYGSSSYSAHQVANNSTKAVAEAVCSYFSQTEHGSIYIHSMNGNTQEDNYACLEVMKSEFPKLYSSWQRVEKVTDFFRKQFYVLCFINPEIHSVCLFVDKLNMTRMHYLQCSIFAFLPWFFNPDEGITEDEMALISSLKEKTSTPYVSAITKLAEQYDFRAILIRNKLAGFETKYEKIKYDELKQEALAITDRIIELNGRIGGLLQEKHNTDIMILGLEAKIAEHSENSEIMEYFLCNKNLSLIDVGANHMKFVVKTYLTYYDEDMVNSALLNPRSYVYCDRDDQLVSEERAASMKKLIHNIFVEQKLKIKCCAAYKFNLNGNVQGLSSFPFGSEFNECMPNPHINEYRCMGSYERTINELLVRRDYIGAIEQCVASCKSLNFADSTVMRTFFGWLYSSNCPTCIELPSGDVVTPQEAIEWIESQEESDNE